MSVVSTNANYGGRINDFQQSIKQFVVSGTTEASWIFRRLVNGTVCQTPATKQVPVLINTDLTVTGSVYNTSDARLKTNLQPIDASCIAQLSTLTPTTFSYLHDPTHRLHYGLIAQEVETVFPELVTETTFKTVNYLELIPLLLAKIHHLEEQVAAIQARSLPV